MRTTRAGCCPPGRDSRFNAAPCAAPALHQRDVTQRDDADETLFAIEHRKTTDLNVAHDSAHFVEFLSS
jgi:hypothetical protein